MRKNNSFETALRATSSSEQNYLSQKLVQRYKNIGKIKKKNNELCSIFLHYRNNFSQDIAF